ncbi:anhydro-N-acetylmuramic acid kinase [Methyloligella sp. 2.7D]|uniref:anhydro-N-acetylmuramic acid kinase n=1 Tax=unclassified Methyloligella TaxID=2625955 RepID=UPI001ABB736E|nr:anhydro-N-acetylmuramic acid kinase [Methyloligella sp. GL2]
MTALGLMSGTSMDGIDVAVISTDGEHLFARGQGLSYPYSAEERERLKSAAQAAWRIWGSRSGGSHPDPADMALLEQVEDELTRAHADAVNRFLDSFGIPRSEIKVVGFHGQTVYHDASRRITRQLGSGALLAKLTGLDVVHHFRAADIAAGGQGAPLVPAYHRALSVEVGLDRPVAIVNIGGVANITFIGADGSVVAFDTGPGNALLDDWVQRHTGEPFDRHGALALRGRVNREVLKRLAAHPYFMRQPPKSLDRYDFPPLEEAGLSVQDGAATLTEFTAREIAQSARFLPHAPRLWVLTGGGAKNPALVQAISKNVSAPVVLADEIGLSSEHLEAEAFAFLAVRSLRKLPLTYPGTTGVRQPLTGGRLIRAPRR